MSLFYNFIYNQWVKKVITEEQIQSYVPKFISQTEMNQIIEKQ